MNSKKLKIKSILHCPVCVNQYGDVHQRPVLMPCGKSICETCVEANLNSEKGFWCPYCCETHKQPTSRKQYPINEALIYLIKNQHDYNLNDESVQQKTTNGGGGDTFRASDDPSSISSSSSSSSSSASSPSTSLSLVSNPKLREVLDEIASNSLALDKTIYTGGQCIKESFARVESEINKRVEKMIDELRISRNELINEVKK